LHRLVGATDEAGMMRVTYLGPMMMANKHPVVAELKSRRFLPVALLWKCAAVKE